MTGVQTCALPICGRPRQRLARWVTHPENRAFARATVNRVWALMFGRPLVEPVDEIPLKNSLENPYPPGLETLADDFIIHKFDLQRLIRVIAATRVFGLDSISPLVPGMGQFTRIGTKWMIDATIPAHLSDAERQEFMAAYPKNYDSVQLKDFLP